MKFEEDAHYEGYEKLGTLKRPQAIGAWIQRARAPAYRPAITNVKQYTEDFSVWWQSLQPEWRRSLCGAGPYLLQQDGDWTHMRRFSGINGLLSVVAALYFWGDVVRGTPATKTWLAAVADVSFVFGNL